MLTALPTTALVVILWIYLKLVLFDPMLKVAADRDAATKGAVAEANAALQRAEAKAAEYEAALHKARGEILKAQDAQRQILQHQQTEKMAEARSQAGEMVESARLRIQAEAASAKASLRPETEKLSEEIASAVLGRSRN